MDIVLLLRSRPGFILIVAMNGSSAENFYLDLVSGRKRGVLAGLLRAALAALTVPYRGVMAFRRLWYRAAAKRVEVPVISVGNLTVGGTGKTPLVAFLAGRLVRMNQRPAIVSRGYRKAPGIMGDEAAALRSELPESVLQAESPNRYKAILELLSSRAVSVILLDDGFQHLRVRRDLDILTVDATSPFGHGHLLPRGLLREPVGQARRADIIVITRSELAEERVLEDIRRRLRPHLRPGSLVVHARHTPVGVCLFNSTSPLPSASLEGVGIMAFCGLGNPEAFYETLRRLGARMITTRSFPDHHGYTASDVAALLAEARHLKVRYIITTTKDYAKVASESLAPLWGGGDKSPELGALKIEMDFREGDDCLDQQLRLLVGGQGRPPSSRGARQRCPQ